MWTIPGVRAANVTQSNGLSYPSTTRTNLFDDASSLPTLSGTLGPITDPHLDHSNDYHFPDLFGLYTEGNDGSGQTLPSNGGAFDYDGLNLGMHQTPPLAVPSTSSAPLHLALAGEMSMVEEGHLCVPKPRTRPFFFLPLL